MGTTILLGVLAFGTLGAATIFGYLSSVRTADRLHHQTRPSTLATDGPSEYHGQKPPDT